MNSGRERNLKFPVASANQKKVVAYVHDHKFSRCKSGGVYSEGKFSNSVFDRYLPCGDRIVVLSRMATGSCNGCNNISHRAVVFLPIRGLSFTKALTRHFVYNFRHLQLVLSDSRVIIIRMPSILGVWAWLFAIYYKKPYFIELAGHPYEAIVNARPLQPGIRVLGELLNRLVRRAVREATGVIYVTKHALQQEFPTKGITAAASNVELEVQAVSPCSHKRLPKGEFKLGVIGSFYNRYKGIDVAIRALALLRTSGMNCQLRVLGSGDRRPYQALAAELGVQTWVFFDGVRNSGQEVYAWLDELSLYVQPSRTEGLPRSLIEAMSRALPCVGSRVGGIPELLDECCLCTPGDSSDLAHRVSVLLSNDVELKKQSARNHKIALEYSREVLTGVREVFWLKAAKLISEDL